MNSCGISWYPVRQPKRTDTLASFNQVTLLGNVTRDIELRYTAAGTAVTEIGMAVNDRIKQGDDWVDQATFVDVTLWGRTAEIANEYLSKGSPVLISGRLKLDQWNDKNSGDKRSKLGVVADKLQLIGGNPNGGGGAQGGGQPRQNQAPQNQGRPEGHNGYQAPAQAGVAQGNDPDLPF